MPTRTIILLVVLMGALVWAMLSFSSGPKTFRIAVDEAGRMSIDENQATIEEVGAAIQSMTQKEARLLVVIEADGDAPAGPVMAVMAAAERAGADIEVETEGQVSTLPVP